MNNWGKAAAIVAGGTLVVGAFWVAAGLPFTNPSASVPATSQTGKEDGYFGKYLYTFSNMKGGSKKLAQFDPTLPADDTVVLGALRELAKQAYGAEIGDDVAPVVETDDEVNYVTFTLGKGKFLFELFKNSKGQVATVRFWQDNIEY